jgi:hypothetical protein
LSSGDDEPDVYRSDTVTKSVDDLRPANQNNKIKQDYGYNSDGSQVQTVYLGGATAAIINTQPTPAASTPDALRQANETAFIGPAVPPSNIYPISPKTSVPPKVVEMDKQRAQVKGLDQAASGLGIVALFLLVIVGIKVFFLR